MRSWRPPAARLPDAAFLAGFLAYAYLAIDPRLVYHWQAPAFYLRRDSLLEFLTYPGGIADALQSLATLAYSSRAAGSLILTAQVAAITVLAGSLLPRWRLLRFVPALALVYTSGLYYYRTPLAWALLLALGAAWLAARSKGPWLAIALAPAVYYAGGMAVVFYGLAVAVRLFAARAPAVAPRRWMPALGGAAVALAFAAIALFVYRANGRDRRLAALDYHTSRETWPAVVEAAARLRSPDFNSLTRYEVNLALHEMHRMGDEMFRFPQADSTLPRLRTETFLPYMLRVTDALLRLGRVNDAEHFGNEAYVLSQYDPRVLALLARVHIVKDQPEAARKFLTVLRDEAGSARWTRERLREIGGQPDAGTRILRARMLRRDDVIPVWQNPEKPDADVNRLLLDQLEQDPANRMAFEFLMGNYLLARDLASARALMPRLGQMTGPAYVRPDGSRRTPRHYQEAMAMYGDGAGKPVELPGLEIEPETLNRMAVFKRLIAQSPGRQAALEAAWSRFRDSYFFYFVFGPGDYR